jgi:hypothetical protein
LLTDRLGGRRDLDSKIKLKEVLKELDIEKKDLEDLARRAVQGRPTNLKRKNISKMTRFQQIVSGEPETALLSNPDKDQCPYRQCAKKFKYRSSLVNHMRLHTGFKEYKCRFCEKPFTTKGNKKDHERRHLRMKLFVCNKCGNRFDRGDDYNQNQSHAASCVGTLVKVTELPKIDIIDFR